MRILFVTATRIGDAILSTGLLAHLIERYPGARITVAAGPAAAPLFEAMPGLDKLISVRKRSLSLHWLDLWRRCIPHRWDLIVDLRRSALPWLLLSGERHMPPATNLDVHRVEHLAATLDLQSTPPPPTCWTSEEDDALAAILVPQGNPVLAIAAAANWPGKQWQPERFAELAERLTSPKGPLPHARIAVLAAAQEADQVGPLLTSIPSDRLINLVGETSLAVAAAVLRRCSFFVGNDSGLMHMSAAVGTPTLGLFGPSRTSHYAPWGELTAFVRTDKSYDEIVGEPGYDHRTTGSVMGSLSVDKAERAARDLWAKVTASEALAAGSKA